MASVFVLGPDIQDTDIQAWVKKNWEFFLKKIKYFQQKNEGVLLDDENLIGTKKNHEAEFFLKISSNEKVVKNSTQFLAWTKVFRISF